MLNVDLSRVPEYYHRYINKVTQKDLVPALEEHVLSTHSFFSSIPEERWDYRYAEGKWSIRDILQHLIDAERIFGFRALAFARQDKTHIPGFNENAYAEVSEASRRSKADLLEEWQLVTRSHLKLFQSFSEAQLESEGIANEASIYVRGIGFIFCGHALHHIGVIKERYLV